MVHILEVFSSFAVDDLAKAKSFYGETLGLTVKQDSMGLTIALPGGASVFVYPKDNHTPAAFTVLNFAVANIDQEIDALTKKGIQFEHYANLPAPQDQKGVLRGLAANMGPDIAWFKDPAGNVLSVLQDAKT